MAMDTYIVQNGQEVGFETGGGGPPPPSVTTIFGYNTAGAAPLSGRLAKWNNRAPCVRQYSGDTYNLNNGNFQFTVAGCPERRVSYSIKHNDSGAQSQSGLATGGGNTMLTDWCESIPDNWKVWLTYFHEVNDDIRLGRMSIANYRDAYEQFRIAIDNATLATGVEVKLASNFMAFQVKNTPSFFSDDWVPPLGVADLMTFDIYGNPGHFTSRLMTPNCVYSEGGEYCTSFPNVTVRFNDMFEAIERNGFAEHWGLLELNTPPRDYDGPLNPDYQCLPNTVSGAKQVRFQGGRTLSGHDITGTEVERAAWLVEAVQHCLTPPMTGSVPPEILLFWEHPQGVNWNQKWYNDRIWNALKPYIIGTPVGG